MNAATGRAHLPRTEDQIMPAAPRTDRPQRVLILGGGYVGLYTALRLKRRMLRREVDITIVDPHAYMTYQPFLAEVAAGTLEPRHVVVSLRRELPGVQVVTGRLTEVRHAARTAYVTTPDGQSGELHYDHLVVAVGSIARILPLPGLDEAGFVFRSVQDAVVLRDQVLDRLDAAAGMSDPASRARALTFVFVGGGYAGIEALGELEDLARAALAQHASLTEADLRFVLVEATDRVLPEIGPDLGRYTVERLRSRGVDVRLRTRLESCVDGHVVLSDGTSLEADTLVWTAGVTSHPVLRTTDLPLDPQGRLRCAADLRVQGEHGIVHGAWAAGDCAAVPDLTGEPGSYCSPSAQHAVRQAHRLGDNLLAAVRGTDPVAYRHRHVGSVASLGLHKGVAQLYGRRLAGPFAWYLHRTYHLTRMPTTNRKLRVILDWALASVFRRDLVSLGRQRPHRSHST